MRLFVYATLKSQIAQRQAMGHAVKGEPAEIQDWREEQVRRDGDTWPTLLPAIGQNVKGEILEVDEADMRRLSQWESRYVRILVMTAEHEAVWTFVARGT